MDLKVYYRKIRAIEADISESDVVVVSQETPDGGRSGVKTEVSKRLAAKLVVEGKARRATKEEAAEYRKQVKEANRKAQERAAASEVKIAIVSDADLRPRRTSKTRK